MSSPYRKRMMEEWRQRKTMRKRIIKQMRARGDSDEVIEDMKLAFVRHTKRDGLRMGIWSVSNHRG